MRKHRRIYAVAAVVVLGLALLTLIPIIGSHARPHAIVSTDEWPSYQFSAAYSGFNPTETVITPTTATNLGALWTFPGVSTQPISSQAVTNNGLIYWGSRDGLLHATDQSGNLAWSHAVSGTSSSACALANMGQTGTPTIAQETINGTLTTVVYGTAGATVAAYDATNGAQLWKISLQSGSFLWSSPVVYNGAVYVGVGSRKCPDTAGQVAQLDATTGTILHTFSTVPAGCLGATVDDTPVLDQALGRLYVLTGRAGSCGTSEPYANSILALNLSDLSFLESWQSPVTTNGDFHATATLFSATINGTSYQLIGAEEVNGSFVAWDRTNLSAGPLWQQTIGKNTSYYYQTAAAWDGTDLYVGGGPTTIGTTKCAGSLRALDPSTGNMLWQTCVQSGPAAGAVTAGPGVAFVGAGTSVVAIATSNGAILSSYTDSTVGASFVVGPAVANGTVIAGNLDGTLVGLAPSSELPTPTATTSTTPTVTPTGTPGSDDWSSYMYGYTHSGENTAETAITPGTVSNLKLHWSYTPTTPSAIFSQPATGNGLIYFGAFDGYERAVDQSGNPVWSTFLGQNNNSGCSPNPVGVVSSATVTTALVNGTPTSVVIVGGVEATVFELNALTGAILWQTSLRGTAGDTSFIWGSPAVYNGAVYIGRSAQECPAQQGEFDMLDLNSGTLLHSFDTVPSGCTGAGPWGSPAIDTTLNRVFIVTADAGKCTSAEPYADGVMSFNANDLSFVDAWQVPVALQGSDSDFGATPTLFTATINGTVHQMIGAVKKSGYFYAWDRTNLSAGPLWATNIGIHTGQPYVATGATGATSSSVNQMNATSDLQQAQGDSSNAASAFTTGLASLVPTSGYSYIAPAAWDGATLYVGGGYASINGVTCKGSLQALDPATGHFLWQTCLQSGPVLGAITLVPGIAFVDEGTKIVAVNTTNGQILYTYKDSAINSFFWGSASVANGLVMTGNQDGTLTVLGL